ncbi:MAG TPA: hypothetical protein VM142_12780 [Acidimicrobiales bacterium]|nr:hypothetical protein [Acidimicrobiales bacterium]
MDQTRMNARHRSSAAAYASEKGAALESDLDDLSLGDVESASTSARLFANVVADKKRRSAK